MKITVFGLGYVGSVVSACMAQDGHDVTGIDYDVSKVSAINCSRSPIVEPELEEAIQSSRCRGAAGANDGRGNWGLFLCFCRNAQQHKWQLCFSQILRVGGQIGQLLAKTKQFHVVTIRSTVLPGTVENQIIPLLESSSGKRLGKDFGFV